VQQQELKMKKANRKSDKRKRDEAAMKIAGTMGHAFFRVEDDPADKAKSRLIAEYSSIESAINFHKRIPSRIYQKISKSKYQLVG
jgi:hypothetical protein